MDIYDFLGLISKQENASDFLNSNRLSDALESIVNQQLGKPSHGSRYFYGRGYKMSELDVEVFYEEGCSCCRGDADSWNIDYQTIWDWLKVSGEVVEVSE